MNRDRQHTLGVFLANHIIIQNLADFLGRRHPIAGLHQMRLVLFTDDIHAKLNAFIANEYRRPGDQLADLMLRLPAEGAVESILGIAGLAHTVSMRSEFADRESQNILPTLIWGKLDRLRPARFMPGWFPWPARAAFQPRDQPARNPALLPPTCSCRVPACAQWHQWVGRCDARRSH